MSLVLPLKSRQTKHLVESFLFNILKVSFSKLNHKTLNKNEKYKKHVDSKRQGQFNKENIYTTSTSQIENLELVDNAFSDHQMVTLKMSASKGRHKDVTSWKISWLAYSKESLCNELSKEDWNM